jgi:hypothetical protein
MLLQLLGVVPIELGGRDEGGLQPVRNRQADHRPARWQFLGQGSARRAYATLPEAARRIEMAMPVGTGPR